MQTTVNLPRCIFNPNNSYISLTPRIHEEKMENDVAPAPKYDMAIHYDPNDFCTFSKKSEAMGQAEMERLSPHIEAIKNRIDYLENLKKNTFPEVYPRFIRTNAIFA